jgi:RNA polymerase sigma factor (sigma-70 family)
MLDRLLLKGHQELFHPGASPWSGEEATMTATIARPSAPEIEELVRSAAAGDRAAQGVLLEQYRYLIRRLVRAHLGDALHAREQTQDLEQEVAMEVLRALPKQDFGDRASFLAWLRSVATHRLIDISRYHFAKCRKGDVATASVNELPAPALPRSPESALDHQRRLTTLEELLDQLPAKQAEAVVLFHQGHDYQEIGAALGCSAEAARKQVARGTAECAKLLHQGVKAGGGSSR